jgi:hypothetical protein
MLDLENIHKNKIIFALVSIFSLQSLYFSIKYKINFPYSMDYLGTSYLLDYLRGGEFPLEQLLQEHSGHYLIFPRLIALPNVLFNSLDVGNFFILQWILLSLSLFVIYLLLRNTDKKLIWLLIPISAFIYCPLASSNYWAFAILLWFIPSLSVMAMIYLLNKPEIRLKIFVGAISLALISTFSSIVGIVVWIPGLILLIKKDKSKQTVKKKWFLAWIIATIITGITYYAFVPHDRIETDLNVLFSLDGYSFVATFAAVAFRLKYPMLMVLVGTFTILLSGFCLYYFIKIKSINRYLPWFLFILVGFVSAVITALGRAFAEFHPGNEPYYIPMAHFIQIGLLVLVSIIIIDVRKNYYQNSKLITVILLSIIIGFSILLVPSYYAGWSRGEYYFNEKLDYLNCFTLSASVKCNESALNVNISAEILNYYLKNDLSIFHEKEFNNQNNNEMNYFKMIEKSSDIILMSQGKIQKINEMNINNNEITVFDSMVIIYGWMASDKGESLDSVYLLVDSEPFLKYNDFYLDPQTEENFGLEKLGIKISFLSGYLDKGCHKIDLIGMKNKQLFSINETYQLCKG